LLGFVVFGVLPAPDPFEHPARALTATRATTSHLAIVVRMLIGTPRLGPAA